MPVGVEDTRAFISVDFIYFSFYCFNKTGILHWGICGDLSLRFGQVVGVVGVDSEHWFCPFFELGHFLPGELISIACDADNSVISKWEIGILEPPSVVFEPLFFISDGLATFDDFWFELCG